MKMSMTLLSAVCSAKVHTNNISTLYHVHIYCTSTNIDSDKKNEQIKLIGFILYWNPFCEKYNKDDLQKPSSLR
jgi:hypothetical protein